MSTPPSCLVPLITSSCCSHYASTSSGPIRVDALKYHSMFPRLASCRPKHRSSALNQFAEWLWCGSFSLSFFLSFCESFSTDFPAALLCFFIFNMRSCLQRWNTSLTDLDQLKLSGERLAAALYVTDRHNTGDGQRAQRSLKYVVTCSTTEDCQTPLFLLRRSVCVQLHLHFHPYTS